MKKFWFLALIGLLSACGGSREVKNEPLPQAKSDTTIVVTNYTPLSGVKYREDRSVDAKQPPVSLDFSKENHPEAALDISKHASSVQFLTLRHPQSDSLGFHRNQALFINEQQGASMSNYSSTVYPTGLGYLVSDLFSGLHLFDADGAFLETIVSQQLPYKKDKTGALEVSRANMNGFGSLISLHAADTIIAYTLQSGTEGVKKVLWYDPVKKQNMMEAQHSREGIRYFPRYKLSDSLYFSNVSPWAAEPLLMRTFTPYGDTLCEFKDFAPRIERPRGNYVPPESLWTYFLDRQFHVRFPYNDTIFTLSSPYRLQPKYIVNMGANRVDAKAGMRGGQHGKLMPGRWIETPSHILFSYNMNQDAPMGRQEGYVRYYYRLYDKQNHRMYALPYTLAPDELLLGNPIPGGLPFYYSDLRYIGADNSFLIVYGKCDIEKILHDKSFSKLPNVQQVRVQECYEGLSEGELLLMRLSAL